VNNPKDWQGAQQKQARIKSECKIALQGKIEKAAAKKMVVLKMKNHMLYKSVFGRQPSVFCPDGSEDKFHF